MPSLRTQILCVAVVAAITTRLTVNASSDDSDNCFLLGGGCQAGGCEESVTASFNSYAKAKKPFPSLTQCYKNNQLACCVSAHDRKIQEDYENLLSETCVREYRELEHYYCLGCNPLQDSYIEWYMKDASRFTCDSNKNFTGDASMLPSSAAGDTCEDARIKSSVANDPRHANSTDLYSKNNKLGKIRLCNSFREILLFSQTSDPRYEGSSTDKVINRYDECGLMSPTGTGYLPSDTRSEEQLPSDINTYYGTDYVKFFDDFRPPYFSKSDFNLEFVADSNENCFAGASSMALALSTLVLSFAVHFWNQFC